jgi:hypothetical protein
MYGMPYTHKPLGLYNKILVQVSLYLFLSLTILVGLSFSPPKPFATIVCYPFTSLIYYFLISSTLTLPMVKDGIRNANGHSNNNAMSPPPHD